MPIETTQRAPPAAGRRPGPPAPSPAPTIEERLRTLARDDKWFLSCGDGFIWAPPFPVWLERPGFWDEAHLHHYAFAPLFTVALVGAAGREIPLRHIRRRWQPDRLTVEWRAGDNLVLLETRTALPGGRFVSSWSRPDGAPWTEGDLAGAHLVSYTTQPASEVSSVGRQVGSSAISWERTLHDRHGIPLETWASLGVETSLNEWTVRMAALRAEEGVVQPHWACTPFPDTWQPDAGIREGIRIGGLSEGGVVFVAVDVPLEAVRESAVAFAITLGAQIPRLESARTARSRRQPTPTWEAFLNDFPAFSCSNPFLARYYDYRLYGLRLNRLTGGSGNLCHPAIAEGIGPFHLPTAYSAQCHMLETRWARTPDLAHGTLLNFLEHQKEDGSFHGRLYVNHLTRTGFYHVNWGDAVLAVDALHHEPDFLKRAFTALVRYADWLDRTRDTEGSGMYDVLDHTETGQEYMSRYQAVGPASDRDGGNGSRRLKGIDATVYAYQLQRALADMAGRLGETAARRRWQAASDRTGHAMTHLMWDGAAGLFSDVDPRTMARTRAKAAVCFYPLLTDLLDAPAVERLLEHLESRDEFGTPYPVPSSSKDDPLFDPHGEWKGRRHNCPWNGRVWPMMNSHVLDGLVRQWQSGRRDVGRYAARLLTRFVSMMYHDRDPDRPNCYEHYNPLTGYPSVYRGIDDHQHSWVIDLLIRGAVGLQPTGAGILIDPLPLSLEHVALHGALVRGHTIDVVRTGSTLDVTYDGRAHTTEVGTPLFLPYA